MRGDSGLVQAKIEWTDKTSPAVHLGILDIHGREDLHQEDFHHVGVSHGHHLEAEKTDLEIDQLLLDDLSNPLQGVPDSIEIDVREIVTNVREIVINVREIVTKIKTIEMEETLEPEKTTEETIDTEETGA